MRVSALFSARLPPLSGIFFLWSGLIATRWRDATALVWVGSHPLAYGGLFTLTLLLASACSSPPPKPAAAPVNLAGFPAPFKEGYLEACESVRRGGVPKPNAKRYAEDRQYAAGWRDGLDMCKKK